MKRFEKKIKEEIKLLPQYEPESRVWESVRLQLDFNDKLSVLAKQLPMKEPGEDVWDNIEQNLKPVQKSHKTMNLIIGLSVAASLALIIGLFFRNHQSNKEKIMVTEEIVNDWGQPFIVKEDTSSQTALKFIEDQCKNRSYVCNMPGFGEKIQQIKEIDTQIKMLDKVVSSSGSSPAIVKSLIKLENIRTRLMKNLLNEITS